MSSIEDTDINNLLLDCMMENEPQIVMRKLIEVKPLLSRLHTSPEVPLPAAAEAQLEEQPSAAAVVASTPAKGSPAAETSPPVTAPEDSMEIDFDDPKPGSKRTRKPVKEVYPWVIDRRTLKPNPAMVKVMT